MPYARRTDTTQQIIVSALRRVGAKVVILNGVIDLLVWFRGKLYLLDTKSRGGRLTKRQQQLVDDGLPVHFPTSVDEALAVIGVEVQSC